MFSCGRGRGVAGLGWAHLFVLGKWLKMCSKGRGVETCEGFEGRSAGVSKENVAIWCRIRHGAAFRPPLRRLGWGGLTARLMSMQTGSTRGHHLANYHCWRIGADLNRHRKHITPCPKMPGNMSACHSTCHTARRGRAAGGGRRETAA